MVSWCALGFCGVFFVDRLFNWRADGISGWTGILGMQCVVFPDASGQLPVGQSCSGGGLLLKFMKIILDNSTC